MRERGRQGGTQAGRERETEREGEMGSRKRRNKNKKYERNAHKKLGGGQKDRQGSPSTKMCVDVCVCGGGENGAHVLERTCTLVNTFASATGSLKGI